MYHAVANIESGLLNHAQGQHSTARPAFSVLLQWQASLPLCQQMPLKIKPEG